MIKWREDRKMLLSKMFGQFIFIKRQVTNISDALFRGQVFCFIWRAIGRISLKPILYLDLCLNFDIDPVEFGKYD